MASWKDTDFYERKKGLINTFRVRRGLKFLSTPFHEAQKNLVRKQTFLSEHENSLSCKFSESLIIQLSLKILFRPRKKTFEKMERDQRREVFFPLQRRGWRIFLGSQEPIEKKKESDLSERKGYRWPYISFLKTSFTLRFRSFIQE